MKAIASPATVCRVAWHRNFRASHRASRPAPRRALFKDVFRPELNFDSNRGECISRRSLTRGPALIDPVRDGTRLMDKPLLIH